MKNITLTLILLIGLLPLKIYSQKINKTKLDSLFDILNTKNKAMGSVAFSKNGSVLYSKTIGYSFLSGNEKIPATNITKYRIGSISKMFTATMILQLIEEGKVKLSTTLDTYFPNIPNAGKITIGNMLKHRSGIHNFTDDSTYIRWMTHPKTKEEMLAIISKNKVDFEPNEKFSYSNSNYVLLGYIIEKITGKSYSKNLMERITSQIGLVNTYVGGKTDISKNESFSYEFNSYWNQCPETDMSIPGGAGAIISTPTDLTKFIEALFSLKLVSVNSLNQMKTMTDGYGMGMFQVPFYDRIAYGHNGGIDGFTSNLAFFPEDTLSIAYCTNGQVYPMNDILIGVLSIYFNKNYSIPKFEKISIKTGELDKYLGVYSSTQIPLKITISKKDNVLFAQATGQSSFPLDATAKDTFKFESAGILMEFNTEKNEFVLKQGGGSFLFTKEK